MTINYAVETYAQFVEDAKPLLAAHWEEIAVNKNEIPLDPDYERYRIMDEGGLIKFITARDDGHLIGYAIYFVIARNHHYAVPWASSDIVFIVPEHRNLGVGNGLFDFAENYLRSLGVRVMQTMTKVAHPALGFLLKSRGHDMVETTYSKLL